MVSLPRGRIAYRVGNENDPGNPFGRSVLAIEVDGRARHELYTRGPSFAWTGTVSANALERFWSALEQAGFPACPMMVPPAGATMRCLTVGEGSDARTVYLPFHARAAGYDVAFSILHTILREMSEGMVKDASATSLSLVDYVTRAEPPRRPVPKPEPVVDRPGLGPGPAFLLAYLPAHRIAHEAKLAHLETLTDPELQRARMFCRGALKISGGTVSEIDERLAEVARKAGVTPDATLGDAVRSELTTAAAKAAWKAGETARTVTIAAELAAHVAYFRASAPANATLRAQAEEHARVLRESAAQLASDLAATGRPLAIRHASDASRMVSLSGDRFADLATLAQDLGTFFRAMRHHLDDAAPRTFDVIDARGLGLRPVRGWDELESKIFRAAQPDLQPILERALALVRADALRVIAGRLEKKRAEGQLAETLDSSVARTNARAKLVEDVRARTMAPEDAYERLAPKSWLGDERRWFVTERVPSGTQLDEPMLSVGGTSWVVRREPSSINALLTICADSKNAALAEEYAFEACRLMAVWGWRTPPRVIWATEEQPRLLAYEGARPFRARADEMLRKVFETKLPPEASAHHVQADFFDEAKLAAKRDLLRANEWPAGAGRNPFEPIAEIWRLGYALSAVLDVGVVLLANAPKLEQLLDPLVDLLD